MERRIDDEKLGDPAESEYLHQLEAVDVHPIFILGLHRSGTSILYQMLTATKAVNPVTSYHLIKYDELLYNYFTKSEEKAKEELTDLLREKGTIDRGIDRLSLDADFAEEYGFLLSRRTISMSLCRANLPLFTQMVKKLQLTAGNNQPILLKNPFDFPNFLYIKTIFPQAKFVFIHRNPLSVLNSTVKSLQFIFSRKHPYTASLSGLYRRLYRGRIILSFLRFCFLAVPWIGASFLVLYLSYSTRYYMKNISKLSSDDYISITYESLCSQPTHTMDLVMRFLNIELKQPINFEKFMRPRVQPLDPVVISLRSLVVALMKSYFRAFEFPSNIQ